MFGYERIFIGGLFRHNTRSLKHFLGLFYGKFLSQEEKCFLRVTTILLILFKKAKLEETKKVFLTRMRLIVMRKTKKIVNHQKIKNSV